MKIYCISRAQAASLSCDVLLMIGGGCKFISINDESMESPWPINENVLQLWFDDDSKSFKKWQADQIKDFVKEDDLAVVIHCSAGICRSGAVGDVLNIVFNHWGSEFYHDNPQIKPNQHVKHTLMEAYGVSFGLIGGEQ